MLTDFIASISFYLLPFLLGRIFFRKTVFAFINGFLIWYAISLFSGYIFPRSFDAVTQITALFAVTGALIRIGVDVLGSEKHLSGKLIFKRIYNSAIPFFPILAFSVFIYFFIWKLYTPYPMQLNWDIYEHITLANVISQGAVSVLPSFLSDTFTFNGYTTLFQTALAGPKSLFHTNLTGVYWWIEYWHYLLTIFATYFLTQKIFRKKELSLLSAFASGLIYESSIVYSNLFLIPQTLAAVLGILLLGEIIKNSDSTETKIPIIKSIIKSVPVIISLLTIFFLHFVIGLAVICVIVSYWLLNNRYLKPHLNKTILILMVMLLAVLGTRFFGGIDLTGREEADYFNLSLFKLANIFVDWYGLTLIFIVPGIYGIFKSDSPNTKKILILGLAATIVSLAPFAYFLKYYVVARYLVNIILVFGIFYTIKNFTPIVRYITGGWMILIFALIFFVNINTYQNFLLFSGFISHISDKELETSKWLNENYISSETLLISDPSTSYILEAASGINSPGGAYMSANNRMGLININDSLHPEIVKASLMEISDRNTAPDKINHRLFVASGRYFAWQKLPEKEKKSFYFNIWSPKLIKEQDVAFLRMLSQSSDFNIVYQNNELIIFEIK